jgi:diacylglycerol O-acyltransferase
VEPGRRMSAADAAWLGLDRPEHLMVVTAVLRLGGRVELEPLRELVHKRLVSTYPTLRMRVAVSRVPLRRPDWRPDRGFDLARHVRSVDLGDDADETGLMRYVGELMALPLDPDHAPWSLTLVQLPGHSAVVARLHHCVADGIALAGVLLSLVEGSEPARRPVSPAGAGRSHRPGVFAVLGAAARTLSGVLLGRRDAPGPLCGQASVGRRAAWTNPLDLDRVKEVARRLEVSVNDVLLAAVAGGLRRWLLDQGHHPADLRVMVPVDLRSGEQPSAELGNRFGIVFVPLPVGTASAAERVAAVRTATTRAKRSAVAPASYLLLGLVGRLPHWGQGLAASLLSRVATVIVTNVPGPRTPLTLAGVPLTSVVFWVPHVGRIGVGVSIFSYAGTVTLGVATNASLGIDPVELVAAVEEELGVLEELPDGAGAPSAG